MQLKKVKVGSYYELNVGIGKCLANGGCFPPAAKFDVVAPFPRGVVYVDPRNIYKEVPAPAEVEKK